MAFFRRGFSAYDDCVGIAVENITEPKRSEEVLRADEAKYRAFLDLAPDGVVISNEEGRIVLVNSQTERLFGWSRADMLQQPVEILIPERLRAQHVIHRKEYLKTPRTRPMGTGLELLGLRADGTEFPVEISLSAVHTQDGLLVYSAIRDITERKRADDLLKQTTAQLERSNAELEQFAYAASHDLQEPLRTIVGTTQLLARDYKDKLDPEAIQWLGFASAGAKRMQALINAILDYARLGVARKPFGQVDCQFAYQAAVENLQPAIKESGAELASGPLPVVIGDSLQIIQLFQNLLANAIKFSAQVRSRIVVSAEEHENEWRIAIKDNGIGIDPKNFGRLFNLFQRLHPHDQYEGTGIGLAICKKIVERHGGRIWVESAPGEGSTFYFTIPKPAAVFEPGSAP